MALYLVARVSWAGLLSAAGLAPLSLDLDLLDRRLPVIFRVHMVVSAIALVLMAATLALRTRPYWHRPLGRVTAMTVLAGGLTALPTALFSVSPPLARAGFFAQGVVWLWLVVVGWRAIRRRDIARHRELMLAMVAVASGAIWLRLALAVIAAWGLPYEASYAVVAWGAWLVPLAIVWLVMRPRRPATA